MLVDKEKIQMCSACIIVGPFVFRSDRALFFKKVKSASNKKMKVRFLTLHCNKLRLAIVLINYQEEVDNVAHL